MGAPEGIQALRRQIGGSIKRTIAPPQRSAPVRRGDVRQLSQYESYEEEKAMKRTIPLFLAASLRCILRRQYLLAVLFNTPVTMKNDYAAQVSHDLPY